MPFPYRFPFEFFRDRNYLREYVLEVRDGMDRLVRRVAQWESAEIEDALNEPSVLTLTVPAGDPGVEALQGGNEVWVWNQDGTIEGKFRLLPGEMLRSHSGRASVQVVAYSYLSLLGEETTWSWEKTGTVAELLGEILARQLSWRPVTLGTVPESIGSLTRTIRVEAQQSLLETLRNLVDTLELKTMFWVDGDRVLQVVDLSASVDSGKQLNVEKNMSSVKQTVKWSEWRTRIYAYGTQTSGSHLVLSDGAQGWKVWKSNGGAGWATLDHSHAGCSNPSSLTGYFGASVPPVQIGDTLKFSTGEVEISSVTVGSTSTTVSWRGSFSPGATAGECKLRRDYLDSVLYRCEMLKTLLISPSDFPPQGQANYTLDVDLVDSDVAALAARADGRTARALFLAEDGRTVLTSVTNALDLETGTVDCTVTVPRVSGVRETPVHLVIGWV